jgi:ADP-ribose pyrophosphatase YjhB (NUDIX family)
MGYTYNSPRPVVSVDNLIFTWDQKELKILLIQRIKEPFKGEWALPGGLVGIDENLSDAALRVLRDTTGVDNAFIEQCHTFGEVARDPRDRVISVAFYACVQYERVEINPGIESSGVGWFAIHDLPDLAFDHLDIINKAIELLKDKFKTNPISFELLPDEFTLSQLQKMVESLIQKPLDKRNFRKKLFRLGLLEELDHSQVKRQANRLATLYRFDKSKYKSIAEKGEKISFY